MRIYFSHFTFHEKKRLITSHENNLCHPQIPYYLINLAVDLERPSFSPRATRGERKSKIMHTRTLDHE